MKTCYVCNELKSMVNFYCNSRAADGHANICKECHKTRMRAIDTRERDRIRNRTPERRRHLRAIVDRWRRSHPDRYQAQNALNNAIRDGKITRGLCAKCGSAKWIHGHHEDYGKPLVVIWLCATCHHQAHANERRVRQGLPAI